MPNRPRVDVGVVTWNTAELSADALRRLLDSDQGCELRVLVHDNASSDGTPDVIARRVPEAHVDAGASNVGFAAGMNQLLAKSDADWFLALNSDAWPEPGAIGRLIGAGEARPRAAAVAPRVERPDGSLEHSTHPFPSVRVALTTGLGLDRVLGRAFADRMLLEGAWAHDRVRRVDWAVGAALLMRRIAVDRIGGFDERFFMYAEDLEWCWRAGRSGWEVWFEPAAVVCHVGNASGARGYGDRRTRAYFANTYRFYREAHGDGAMRLYRALNLAGALRRHALARVRRDRDAAAYWRSVARAHRGPVVEEGPPA
ncbi:MAG: glycosyl transferase family 2 [Acidimicrobiales bacterium]|jgi:N-acetylglucosaminyl-diphospho-decaprenol L-rhamnosyltransferase|nr:glycosyl transferase family 2 [Acidimicrobiales bacterium]